MKITNFWERTENIFFKKKLNWIHYKILGGHTKNKTSWLQLLVFQMLLLFLCSEMYLIGVNMLVKIKDLGFNLN